MATHPYAEAAPYRKWRQAMGQVPPEAIDPVVRMKWRIGRDTRIVTAGSCFAQHIARWLRGHGFNFLVTEPAHPLLPQDLAERFGYGVYSARYGNIYTSRQLLQLVQRAYGQRQPEDDVWHHGGRWYDPYRPSIQPEGFATEREFFLDRAAHFAAVRNAFETMDVLVFTLGLTECWANRADGTVYPVCPGTAAGIFEHGRHELLTLSVAETVADFQAALAAIRVFNPRCRVILTVSPVALAATALDRHVLLSNTYSKSVLRVAADILAQDDGIGYFPAYEIITNPAARGRYIADDLRSVTQDGVDHVMRLFAQHGTAGADETPAVAPQQAAPEHFDKLKSLVAVLCEEDALDPGPG